MTSVPRRVIGITGQRATGKDEAGDYFERSQGWPHQSLSELLRQIAAAQDTHQSRETLIETGRMLRVKKGGGVLVMSALEHCEAKCQGEFDTVVVSGHFTPEETDTIRQLGGTIVYLRADDELRLRLEIARRRSDAPESIEAMLRQGQSEYEGLGGPNTPNLSYAERVADIIIWNDGTNGFYAILDNVANSLLAK